MVLQQAPQTPIVWGFIYNIGTKSLQIHATLQLSGTDAVEHYKGNMKTTPENGYATWEVMMTPHVSGGPYDLFIHVEGVNMTLKDVLFGDVWLCSGQSNMEFHVAQVQVQTMNAFY